MRYAIFPIVALALLGCTPPGQPRAAVSDAVHQALDKPALPVDIDPIVVREEYAIVGWVQGERGGRVLLHQDHGKWKVVAQGGEEMRSAQFLKDAGVPQKEASALYNVLLTAERKVPEARLALLDKYVASGVSR